MLFLHINRHGAIAVLTNKYAAFNSIFSPVGPPGMYVERYQSIQPTWATADTNMKMYILINIVINAVASIVTNKSINGKDLSIPEDIKLDKKTLGVCITITDAAPKQVERVIHITNLAGLKTIVGRPITMAKKPNTKDAIIKYNEYFTRCWKAALKGPAFASIVPESAWSWPATESWIPDNLV